MKLTLLSLAVIAACLIAVRSISPDSPRPPAAAPSPTPITHTGVEQEHRTSPVAVKPVTIDAPETELVMGIEVRRDRNCTVQRHYVDLGDGTVTDAYSCVPEKAALDDYEHYSDEELRVLSYNDAHAASVLGKRLVGVDLEGSRALLLRAVALRPANLDPVMWLAAQAHSLRGDSPAAQDARANTYVLTRTAQAMGSAEDIEWVLKDLERSGFGADDIAGLEEQVKNNLKRIREIQLEVHGVSVVDEVLL